MDIETEQTPEPTTAIEVASGIFRLTGADPEPGWKKFVERSINEGPDGQTKLLMALCKPIAENEFEKTPPDAKKVANVIFKNFSNLKARKQDMAVNSTVQLTDLKSGHEELSANGVFEVIKMLGGEIEPHKYAKNGGEIIDQTGGVDQATVTFPYLPLVILRVQLKDTGTAYRSGLTKESEQLEQMFNSKSAVTELTAVPVLEQTSSDDLINLW